MRGNSVVQRDPPGFGSRLVHHLDRSGDRPLSRQIVEFVWEEVVSGAVETGERLPTARQLAIDLGVSPNTVERAYAELKRLGVAESRPGEGTFVSLSPPPDEVRERVRALERTAREAADRVRALGLSLDELIEFLAELRDLRREQSE